MTKNDIATRLAKQLQEEGMTTSLAIKAVNEVLQILQQSLKNKETIYLRGFATIDTVVRKAHKGYDFHKKKIVHVPERRIVRLTTSKEFTDSIN